MAEYMPPPTEPGLGVALLSQRTGVELLVPDEPHITGALGAALSASGAGGAV